MNALLVFAFVVGSCMAVPASPPQVGQVIQILRQHSEINPDGSYNWGYETENGINAQEQGELKNVGSEEPALEAQGSFQYTAPDGTPIAVQYVANENGFQPQGEHLPTPPPIPEAILRALAYIEAHPPQEQPAPQQG